MSEDLKECPLCQCPYAYASSDTHYTCPECSHEWDVSVESTSSSSSDELVVLDVNGVVLQSGDSVVVIKDLPVKGAPKSIKSGTKVKKELSPDVVNLNNNFTDIKMNSGFTKIYSALISDFVIYDSRVGAALGLLLRKFLEEKNIKSIPDTLKFAYGKARPTKNEDSYQKFRNSRDPSNDKYIFPCLNNNQLGHIKNNIKANWLLKEVSSRSKFNIEPTPIRALESALFMIGYFVRN